MFDPKRRVRSRRIEVKLFNMIHGREARAGSQFVFERFDMGRRTFGQHLDSAVVQVLYITNDPVARGGALRKETITHALHLATDEKLTRNWRHIR
jgi:hypothetical protein